jgi:hypothetical protein
LIWPSIGLLFQGVSIANSTAPRSRRRVLANCARKENPELVTVAIHCASRLVRRQRKHRTKLQGKFAHSIGAGTEAQKAVTVSLLHRRHAAGWFQQQSGDPAGGEMSSAQGRMQTPLLVLEKARSISLPVASNWSLWKLGGTQATGYRLRPYAKLFRNRELGMPLMPQLHHGQVLLVSCLAAFLPASFDQRRSSGSLCLYIPRQFRPGLHLQLLDLTLDRLGQIAHQVTPIVEFRKARNVDYVPSTYPLDAF